MGNNLFYSFAVTFIFFLFKFLEAKFQKEDERKPLKILIRETLVVFISSMIGIYLYSQFDLSHLAGGKGVGKSTMAFIDNPSF
jgi:hypothetical protein